MIRTILLWVAVAMGLSLLAMWLWQGGYWRIAEYIQVIPNPVESGFDGDYMTLPGQPEMWEVPDTTSPEMPIEYGAADYQYPQDQLYAETPLPNNTSPYSGTVFLQAGAAQGSAPESEYIVITASSYLQSPLNLAGWRVRSVLTGESALVPMAAPSFRQGVVNAVEPITLRAGESIVLSSGVSPVGVSFRENSCTGYLAATQSFTPSLANACARPTDLLPRTPENEARYGSSCIDFVERLAPCSMPTNMPTTLSQSCRAYLSATFTYNGCMMAYANRGGYGVGAWRAYVVSGRELWRNSHDTIVLQDSYGRTVATLTY